MKEIVWSAVFKAANLSRITNCVKVLTSLILSKIIKKNIFWGIPFIMTIEPASVCNLKCPQCLTGLKKIKRKQSLMNAGLFKQIIEQIGNNIWYLLLFNQGEPFLNNQIINFIELAKQKKIYVTTSSNGHFCEDKSTIERLIKSGLDSIFISLDGTDEQTYLKYRVGGSFDKVVRGIKLLIDCRKKLKSKTPKVFVQFLVMKHNEQQMGKMKTLIKQLGADRLLFKTVQIVNSIGASNYLPQNEKFDRFNYRAKKLNRTNQKCTRLWYSTVVLSDGNVVPCCFDKTGKYSFAEISNTTSIRQIWKANGIKQFRNKFTKKSFDICDNCTQNKKVYI